MIRVTENFRKIQDLLAKAAMDADRPPESVSLLAASKTQSAETVLEAVKCGHFDFGENFVAEGIAKIKATETKALIWHFIGHLQSNKTRAVAEHFAWVHTVDRLKIAERLSAQRPYYADDLNVCVQVNIDADPAKSGIAPDATMELAQAINELPKLRLRGLMCIPAASDTFDKQRVPFRNLRLLSEQLSAANLPIDTLSMGMTGDYAAAIREGATMVRIGTALFGPRGN